MANNSSAIGLLRCGAALPPTIRRSDDPIFKHIHRHANVHHQSEEDLFSGIDARHILLPEEKLTDFVVKACQHALDGARLSKKHIERLYGYLSVSQFLAPNALFEVHSDLGLEPSCMVVPINSEYSNFVLSLIHAWEAIECGHIHHALVASGLNWTMHLDYHQGHSISLGDGAGGAIIGKNAPWVFVDYVTQTLSNRYGAMAMQSGPTRNDATQQGVHYHIEPEAGMASFKNDGMERPIDLILGLLKRNAIPASAIGLFTHQATRQLLDHWHHRIKPGRLYDTLANFGNLTFATLPVNLAHFWQTIDQEYLVLHALGVGFHQAALLLRRSP